MKPKYLPNILTFSVALLVSGFAMAAVGSDQSLAFTCCSQDHVQGKLVVVVDNDDPYDHAHYAIIDLKHCDICSPLDTDGNVLMTEITHPLNLYEWGDINIIVQKSPFSAGQQYCVEPRSNYHFEDVWPGTNPLDDSYPGILMCQNAPTTCGSGGGEPEF